MATEVKVHGRKMIECKSCGVFTIPICPSCSQLLVDDSGSDTKNVGYSKNSIGAWELVPGFRCPCGMVPRISPEGDVLWCELCNSMFDKSHASISSGIANDNSSHELKIWIEVGALRNVLAKLDEIICPTVTFNLDSEERIDLNETLVRSMIRCAKLTKQIVTSSIPESVLRRAERDS